MSNKREMKKRVSWDMLREASACICGLNWFELHHPDGIELKRKNIARLVSQLWNCRYTFTREQHFNKISMKLNHVCSSMMYFLDAVKNPIYDIEWKMKYGLNIPSDKVDVLKKTDVHYGFIDNMRNVGSTYDNILSRTPKEWKVLFGKYWRIYREAKMMEYRDIITREAWASIKHNREVYNDLIKLKERYER